MSLCFSIGKIFRFAYLEFSIKTVASQDKHNHNQTLLRLLMFLGMEPDRILVAAGLTAAAVVGAFVFWGPSTGSGSRRGRLAGLVNLGRTCFLNAILHALAACPHFVHWLEKDGTKETSLRTTLATVLSGIEYFLAI